MNPGDIIAYQDCLWRVLWIEDGKAGIQSCGGTEAITVPIADLEVWS